MPVNPSHPQRRCRCKRGHLERTKGSLRFIQIAVDCPRNPRTSTPRMKTESLQYVAYRRVSSDKQGESGLSLEHQENTIRDYVQRAGGEIVADFCEVESGKKTDREQLLKAIELCRKTGAKLICSKLDRIARNTRLFLTLRDSGIQMVFCDLPDAGPFSNFIQNLFACLAEQEREWISTRTKNALKVLKSKGVRLGTANPQKAVAAMVKARRATTRLFAKTTRPIIDEIVEAGVTSPSEIARCLNRRGIPTANGRKWWPNTVKDLLNAA